MTLDILHINDIPYIKGLIKELNERVKSGLILLKKRDLGKGEWSHLDRTNPLEEKILKQFSSQDVSYDISNKEESFFGTVYITTYEVDKIVRVGRISYEGDMPGYTNAFGKEFASMEATEEFYPISMLNPTILKFDLTRKNNILEEPLYRHDTERLKFVDHEVDGKVREAYFAEITKEE
jgi:hypothetical protein